MKPKSHKTLTEFVFDLLSETVDYFTLAASKEIVAQQARDTDFAEDLEFVDVDFDRDDPHKDDGAWVDDDEAHYYDASFFGAFGEHYFTAFNHFIDIRKGKADAKFDDFDGYSYHHGSASELQFEDYQVGAVAMKIDAAINYWLNDEYVHVPGRAWYRDCSPSVPRYSFPEDRGIYGSRTDEGKARFPLAVSEGKKNKGIPYSVFMPVDNMARFWYRNYETSRDPKDLGYVMHTIQDASIPHHAAGYCGNWHGKYEEKVRDRLEGWMADPNFRKGVKALFEEWSKLDPSPPSALDVGDEFLKVPRRNWKIEWMVTWMAMNAYRAYIDAHQNFANGWTDNEASMKELTKKAAAMSMLALYEASIAEQCYAFDYNLVQVMNLGGLWWVAVPSGAVLKPIERFSLEAEAKRGREIIQHYKMNSRCTVGRSPYYLSGGKAPNSQPGLGCGPLGGEQSVYFDPEAIEVGLSGSHWVIAQGTDVIIDFGPYQDDAKKTYHVIQKYGFNRYCWLGEKDNPSMRYFLLGLEKAQIAPGTLPPGGPTLPGPVPG